MLGSLEMCPTGLTKGGRKSAGLLLPNKQRSRKRSNEEMKTLNCPYLLRFFANLTGNPTWFSAQDESEEAGGDGFLACRLPDGNKDKKC